MNTITMPITEKLIGDSRTFMEVAEKYLRDIRAHPSQNVRSKNVHQRYDDGLIREQAIEEFEIAQMIASTLMNSETHSSDDARVTISMDHYNLMCRTVRLRELSKIRQIAPWNEEQCDQLEEHQNDPMRHSYTCVCGEDLKVGYEGMSCPSCSYVQRWF